MFCPQCGAEYREGFSTCSDCDVPLVEVLPAEPVFEEPLPVDLVAVLETSDPSLIAIAQSWLESADIHYVIKRAGVPELIGGGHTGTGFNPVTGPVEIMVERSEEENARDLLSQIEEERLSANVPESDPEETLSEEDEEDAWVDRSGVSSRAKAFFRVLVVAEMALMFISLKLFTSLNESVPDEVRTFLNTLCYSEALRRFAVDWYSLMLLVSIAAASGLMIFWGPARYLYLLSWLWGVLNSALMGGSIMYGLSSLCLGLQALMGGAIIAMMFFPPVKAAFRTY